MTEYDIIFVLPYTFSDHPSFPEGILRRTLEAAGFRIGVIETPFWQKSESFTVLGKPRLFFAIIPGPVDSVVLNYTSSRKRRKEDLYQGDGQAYFPGYPPSIQYKIRPDRTVTVFANGIRHTFKDTPIVIGGIEASLRRFTHYDFQQDKLRRSILLDSRADILVTGMGEIQLLAIAQKAQQGANIKELHLPGTACITKTITGFNGYAQIPSMTEIEKEKHKLVEGMLIIEKAAAKGQGVIQPHEGRYIIDHPAPSYHREILDGIYGHPYSRTHPFREGHGLSAALQMNLFSVTSHRGCGGGCSFCSISMHEGKRVISRSEESILKEIQDLNRHPRWQGIVSDIGGATAELYGSDCSDNQCPRISCFSKKICPTIASTQRYLELLRSARRLPGVRKIFLGSGIRFDLLLKNPELLEEILTFHSGKFLRVAPEHSEDEILTSMRKSNFQDFIQFTALFNRISHKLKRQVELAPYVMIGYPGETREHVKTMAYKFKSLGLKATDAQIFTPTPGTLATAIYYAGSDIRGKVIPIERNIKNLMERKSLLTSL